jgi:hypothetical protein
MTVAYAPELGATLGWRVSTGNEPPWEGLVTVPYGPPNSEYSEGAIWFADFMRRHQLTSETASHVLGVNPARVWEWLHARRPLPGDVRQRLERWAADGRPRFAYWDSDQYRGWGSPERACTCDGFDGASQAAAIAVPVEPVTSWPETGPPWDAILSPSAGIDWPAEQLDFAETGTATAASEVAGPVATAGTDIETPTDIAEPVRSHRYRPPSPPRVTERRREAGQRTRERAQGVDVRIVFDRSGDCRLSLLPKRAAGMPEQLVVSGSGNPPELVALQDEWYQDVSVEEPGRLLQEGVTWSGELCDGRRARWSMGGRAIYVFARHQKLSGFVSTPRLVLGEEQAVLCLCERLGEVREAIRLTGSPEPLILDAGCGSPAGWVCLRGATPQNPVPPREESDILNALCPLADIEIVLDGGIRIERQVWLAGYAPRVRVHGDVKMASPVTIDSAPATQDDQGGYTVAGCDLPGLHTVRCGSTSKNYEIREALEAWDAWDSYTWSMGEQNATVAGNHPAVCGVLVLPPGEVTEQRRVVLVPASHRVLLGTVPGQIQICSKRGDIPLGKCMVFPEFDPVWALPVDVFRCDKRTTRVLLIGEPGTVTPGGMLPNAEKEQTSRGAPTSRRQVQAWCAAICSAARKGLETEPGEDEISLLWQQYKRFARSLQRRTRQ